jgi:hypothetical protein
MPVAVNFSDGKRGADKTRLSLLINWRVFGTLQGRLLNLLLGEEKYCDLANLIVLKRACSARRWARHRRLHVAVPRGGRAWPCCSVAAGEAALAGHRLFPMAAPTGDTIMIIAWLVLAVAAILAPRRFEC